MGKNEGNGGATTMNPLPHRAPITNKLTISKAIDIGSKDNQCVNASIVGDVRLYGHVCDKEQNSDCAMKQYRIQ